MKDLVGRRLEDITSGDVSDKFKDRILEVKSKKPNVGDPVYVEVGEIAWDDFTTAVNNMLVYVPYNYKITVGDKYYFLVELPEHDNEPEFIIAIDEQGPYVLAVRSIEDLEECGEAYFEFEALMC